MEEEVVSWLLKDIKGTSRLDKGPHSDFWPCYKYRMKKKILIKKLRQALKSHAQTHK